MSTPTKIEGDLFVNGELRSKSQVVPDGSIDNAAIAALAGLAATKLEHQHALIYSQAAGSDIVAATVPIKIIRGLSGLVVDVEVVAQTAPVGGDLAFTVDVLKATEASPSPDSILQSIITVDATNADYEIVQGTVDNGDMSDGETMMVAVAVSGSTGSQGQGLVVTVTLREDAE